MRFPFLPGLALLLCGFASMGRTIEAPKTIQAIQIAATQEPFTPHPVITEGVVTWDDPKEATRFYLQDKTGGILVTARSPALLRSGDFVKVTGIVNRGPFSPVIEQAAVQKAGVAPLPEAKTASGGGVLNGAYNGERVEVNGWVRTAELIEPNILRAELDSGAARITVQIGNVHGLNPETLIASKFRVRGVASPVKARGAIGQLVEVQVLASRQENLSIDSTDPSNPWNRPLISLRNAFQFRPGQTRSERLHIRGTVVAHHADVVYLNDGQSGLAVRGKGASLLTRGQAVEAVGFLDLEEFLPILADAVFRPAKTPAAKVNPVALPVAELLRGLQHANYVSVTGKLLDRMQAPLPAGAEAGTMLALALQSPRGVFMAEFHAPRPDPIPPGVEVGSTLRVSGICLVQTDAKGNPAGFRIVLPTIEAISIVEPARFFNTKRLLILLSITLGTLLLVTGGALLLARRNIGLLAEMRERGAVAAERSRLARDLHDTLEQGLTGLHLHLHSIGPSVDEASEETQKRLGTIRSLVQQCHSELRQSIWNLRTSAVDPFDLGEALERIAHSLVLGSAIHVELRQQRAPVKIPSLVEDNLLRIGQEALTNVVKHANAFRLRIALTISRRHVTLAISDDGRGFQTGDHAGASSGHFGILGMRERAARIGGTLTLHSTPQSGCLVQVDVPLRERTQTFPSSP